MQDGSYLEEAPEVAKSRVLGWATSFSVVQHVGFEAGQLFVNPLHQMHECGSKVSFTLEQASQAIPWCLYSMTWSSLWVADMLQIAPQGM